MTGLWHGANSNIEDNIVTSRSWKELVKVSGHHKSNKRLLTPEMGDGLKKGSYVLFLTVFLCDFKHA